MTIPSGETTKAMIVELQTELEEDWELGGMVQPAKAAEMGKEFRETNLWKLALSLRVQPTFSFCSTVSSVS